jgi:hypothetical protein
MLLLLIVAIGGACNRSTLKLHPVKGKVTYKDKPTEGASVVFQPVNGVSAEHPMAYADVKADGSFQLRTEPHGEGAVAGEYHVLIMWYGSASGEVLDAKSKLPAKFADPANPILKATVKEGPNELEPFALQ